MKAEEVHLAGCKRNEHAIEAAALASSTEKHRLEAVTAGPVVRSLGPLLAACWASEVELHVFARLVV